MELIIVAICIFIWYIIDLVVFIEIRKRKFFGAPICSKLPLFPYLLYKYWRSTK